MRRSAGVEEKGKRKRGKRSRQASRAELEEESGPGPHREHTEVGVVCSDHASIVRACNIQNILEQPALFRNLIEDFGLKWLC